MSHMIFDLTVLRRSALRLILTVIWLQIGLIALAGWWCDAPILPLVGVGLAIAATAQVVASLNPGGGHARIAAGIALMALISILVAIFDGQKVQVDLHMYYFAALAMLVTTCDWRVILAGTLIVAVHHTVLNFLLPALVYPGGPDLFRLALHAIVLVMEAAVLIWLAVRLEAMFGAIRSESSHAEISRLAAEKSHSEALAAARQAEASYRLHESVQAQVAEEDQTTLRSLACALDSLADGDLTYRMQTPLPAKSEALRHSFNTAIEKLQAAMQAVETSAAAIRTGSREISAAIDDLSRRTERQAAGLQESATALDHVTMTVRKTAEGGADARKVVNTAIDSAARSGDVVHHAVSAMSGIEQSSQQMSQIIGVIDEIAFQTNLLALNAGVEAARAGDAGRGFAVVASEVRALAQRSADAAKEIKTLISRSSQQVDTGVDLVKQAGKTLEVITAQVTELDGVVERIAASAQGQSTSLQQVNTAVNQIDQATQQNVAMVEQTTAASHHLMEETETLSRLLGSFRVSDSGVIAWNKNVGTEPRRRTA